MNGKSKHFTDFRRAHRQSMLTQVEKLPLTKSNGSGRGPISPLQESFDTRPVSLWERLFKGEELIVAGREVRGFVVSPFAAGLITTVVGVLLAASITITITLYSSMSTQIGFQRDMLIEMKTRLEEKTTAAEKLEMRRAVEEKQDRDLNQVWRETMSQRMSKLEVGGRN